MTPVTLAPIVVLAVALPPVLAFSSIFGLPAIAPMPTVVLRHTPRLLYALQLAEIIADK